MPTNLTGSSVSSTYDQLLHVDDGPTASEKTVYSGTGVATALKISTGSASVDNLKLDGNTISSTDTNGNIVLSPDGTGTVNFSKANITGGVITGVGLSGLSADLPIADGGTGASTAAAARTNLGLGTIATQNANAVALTGGSLSGVSVPFADITGRKYGQFYSTQDQTPAANTPTALTFNNSSAFNTGVTVASSSQITYDTAGTYVITVSVQFDNKDSTNHDAYIWFRKNGTDIADSNSITSVPKSADGGNALLQVSIIESFTATQYVEVVTMVVSANVDIEHVAAAVGPPAYPAVPSVILITDRIG
jgi:hypothetical protein